MAYINTNILVKSGLSLQEITLLQLIKQNKFEDTSSILQENKDAFISLKDKEFVSFVKNKKSDFEAARTTKKADKLLEDLNTAEVTEDDLKVFNWVADIYVRQGKEIGNAKKTKTFVAQFSKESGIVKNNLAILIKEFITDEKEFEYSKKLQFLFFKGDSFFNVKFDLHASRLYQYYLKNKNYFDGKFE